MTNKTNFEWTFAMSDGSTKQTTATIENLLYSGDDLTNSTVNIKDSTDNRFSALVPLNYFLGKIYNDQNTTANATTLISDLETNSKTLFQTYYSGDVSSVTNTQWINLLSNTTIVVTPLNNASVDIFDGYIGKYTFTVANGNSGETFSLQIKEISSNGEIINNTYTLTNGDSITIFGAKYNTDVYYTVLAKQIKGNNGTIVLTGDLSTSGATQTLVIPNIGISFVFSYTGTSSYNCIVKGTTNNVNNVDLRRVTVWGGSATETYTIDDSTVTTTGTNIDSTVYGSSQDVSMVFVCVNGIVWKVTYWTSASNKRFRAMAEQTFV